METDESEDFEASRVGLKALSGSSAWTSIEGAKGWVEEINFVADICGLRRPLDDFDLGSLLPMEPTLCKVSGVRTIMFVWLWLKISI